MELPKIKVANFEGPFDLLLHLIKKNKMDIYNVEIYKITNQYLAYLDTMKEMDLEITSEFIVIAATLIEIKSKTLLPKIKNNTEEEDEKDIEKKLLEKLILYKKIKASTLFFKDKYLNSGEVYSKKPEIIEEIKKDKNSDDSLKNISLLDLYHIYNDLLEIYLNKQNKTSTIQKNIQVDKYKIEDKIEYLKDKIPKEKVVDFNDLTSNCECKLEYVVTFLALLELMKLKEVKVYQNEGFGNILVKRRVEKNE
jgi:segregation and condensation protein A